MESTESTREEIRRIEAEIHQDKDGVLIELAEIVGDVAAEVENIQAWQAVDGCENRHLVRTLASEVTSLKIAPTTRKDAAEIVAIKQLELVHTDELLSMVRGFADRISEHNRGAAERFRKRMAAHDVALRVGAVMHRAEVKKLEAENAQTRESLGLAPGGGALRLWLAQRQRQLT